jgi:hypothetical protein
MESVVLMMGRSGFQPPTSELPAVLHSIWIGIGAFYQPAHCPSIGGIACRDSCPATRSRNHFGSPALAPRREDDSPADLDPLRHREVFVQPGEQEKDTQAPPDGECKVRPAREHRIDRTDQPKLVSRLQKQWGEMALLEILAELPVDGNVAAVDPAGPPPMTITSPRVSADFGIPAEIRGGWRILPDLATAGCAGG